MSYYTALNNFIESVAFWDAVVETTNEHSPLAVRLWTDGLWEVVSQPQLDTGISVDLGIESLEHFPVCCEDTDWVIPAASSREYEYRLPGCIANLYEQLNSRLEPQSDPLNYEF